MDRLQPEITTEGVHWGRFLHTGQRFIMLISKIVQYVYAFFIFFLLQTKWNVEVVKMNKPKMATEKGWVALLFEDKHINLQSQTHTCRLWYVVCFCFWVEAALSPPSVHIFSPCLSLTECLPLPSLMWSCSCTILACNCLCTSVCTHCMSRCCKYETLVCVFTLDVCDSIHSVHLGHSRVNKFVLRYIAMCKIISNICSSWDCRKGSFAL